MGYAGDIAGEVIDDALASGDPIGALRAFVEMWRGAFERSGGRAGCPVVAIAVETHDDAPELLDAAAMRSPGGSAASAARFAALASPRDRADRLAALVVSAVEGGIVLSRAQRDPRPLLDVARELEDDPARRDSGGPSAQLEVEVLRFALLEPELVVLRLVAKELGRLLEDVLILLALLAGSPAGSSAGGGSGASSESGSPTSSSSIGCSTVSIPTAGLSSEIGSSGCSSEMGSSGCSSETGSSGCSSEAGSSGSSSEAGSASASCEAGSSCASSTRSPAFSSSRSRSRSSRSSSSSSA